MAAGLAEHFLHQLRRAVGDLGLVGEIEGALLTNTPSFTTLSTRSSEPSAAFICASSMMPQRRAAAIPAFEVHVLAKPALDQAAVLGEADLAGDVEQAVCSTAGT